MERAVRGCVRASNAIINPAVTFQLIVEERSLMILSERNVARVYSLDFLKC